MGLEENQAKANMNETVGGNRENRLEKQGDLKRRHDHLFEEMAGNLPTHIPTEYWSPSPKTALGASPSKPQM